MTYTAEILWGTPRLPADEDMGFLAGWAISDYA